MTQLGYFHSHVQVITRGKGKSAVCAAAYRAGEKIKNEYDGEIHDYTRKGGVIHTEIILPDHAPREYYDRAILWNAVEKIEKAANSQLARELDIALPIQLTMEQNLSLARRYVEETFVRAGMCADLCVHDKGDGNPHFHVMLTTRPINDNGKWGSKQKKEYILDNDGNKQYDPVKRSYKCRSIPSTDWNNYENADLWRKAWEDMTNAELQANGFDIRIDRRSYAEQGIEQIPTVHMGAATSQMEKRGIRTERGDMNRAIAITNNEIKQLRARINKLNKWVAEEAANTTPPTLADVITEILTRQGQSGISKLKAASQMLIFLTENNIMEVVDLGQKVSAMNNKLISLNEDRKKVQRRIDTLNNHIMHSENYKKYRKIKTQYDKLYAEYESIKKAGGFRSERKAQKALDAANDYHYDNSPQIAMYENAEEYLRGVLQKRFDPKKSPPIDTWRRELGTKTSEVNALYREYTALKEEIYKVEKIRASVNVIMQEEMPITQPERTPKKSRGMEM